MKQTIVPAFAILAGCAIAPAADDVARVSPTQLAATPASWDGRLVEVSGLMTWEFENFGLYQNYDSYCSGADDAAIYVEWPDWRGVTTADNRRQVTVRGTFRNWAGVKQPNGQLLISTGATGPGPLEPGEVVRWESPPLPPCGTSGSH
jgi:hypothetical protein